MECELLGATQVWEIYFLSDLGPLMTRERNALCRVYRWRLPHVCWWRSGMVGYFFLDTYINA